jgi:hypothetical protein
MSRLPDCAALRACGADMDLEDPMQEVEDVRALEQIRFNAMLAGDLNTLADLLDTRLIYVHSSGLADTRQSYLEALAKAEYTYHSVEVSRENGAIVEGDIVIINRDISVSMTVRSTGQTVSRQINATSTWVRSAARHAWLLLASHSTNIAQ